MKRYIRSNVGPSGEYEVSVLFDVQGGSERVYTIDCESDLDAESFALEQAYNDLSIEEEDVSFISDGEYEVYVSFAGAGRMYTVEAGNEEEAMEEARDVASEDLSAEVVNFYPYSY